MTEIAINVYVVDDDVSVRKSLRRLLRASGYQTREFATAQEFLLHDRCDGPACLILDVQLPEVGGLELQEQLSAARVTLPIIFITGHADIPMTVRAMKGGAVEFLPKPFDSRVLMSAIEQAVAKDSQSRQNSADNLLLRQRFNNLSVREVEVLGLVVSGLLNKQIGTRLGITEKTVKAHRGQVMRKMEASSLAELVRMAEKLGIGQ